MKKLSLAILFFCVIVWADSQDLSESTDNSNKNNYAKLYGKVI